jgi:Rrf2 family transcriptional regulator, nitric oxide-sensitive transcriptional repressor
MRLTRYTDYSMRVLMYLATHPDRICTIPEMARAYGISLNHLMKVVHQLGKAGYVTAVRGRYGGVKLARPAEAINAGAVIRYSETQPGAEGLAMLDCPACPVAPACGLTGAVDEALAAFFAVLERYTLADLVAQRTSALLEIFAATTPGREMEKVEAPS